MQQIKSSFSNELPLIIGISGGSGSGKTFFANDLMTALGPELCSLVLQDNFYYDQSKNFDFDGGSVNFDHPSAIEFSLLADRLSALKAGKSVEIPVYDFATHQRLSQTLNLPSRPIVLVDGILILHSKLVRNFLDISIFFNTPEELRYSRRLERDTKERGRTPEGVRNQFLNQVKPMHDQFVKPSMEFADWIVNEHGDYHLTLKAVLNLCKEALGSYETNSLQLPLESRP
jgi:uridine kinase